MKVTLLGTSGGIPISGRAQSGVLVESSNSNILLDCGMGAPLRLAEAGFSAEEVDIICLTHGHLDHIQDLPSLTKASWLDVGEADYQIVLPPNLKDKLIDVWKRLEEYDRTDLSFKVLKPGERLYGNVDIRAFKTEHTPSSQGYRIMEDDNSLIYTGDTAPCEGVREKAEGIELLIHELSLLEESEVHTDPKRLIRNIEGIEVSELVITHFYPQVAERADGLAKKIERNSGVKTSAGEDLQEHNI